MSLHKHAAVPLAMSGPLEDVSFGIDATENGFFLLLLYDGQPVDQGRILGRLSGGIEWTIGNSLVNALGDGIVEIVKYDAYLGKVWNRVSQSRLSDIAEEIEHNPDIDVDRVVCSMISSMDRLEYIVKVGFKIPRRG